MIEITLSVEELLNDPESDIGKIYAEIKNNNDELGANIHDPEQFNSKFISPNHKL